MSEDYNEQGDVHHVTTPPPPPGDPVNSTLDAQGDVEVITQAAPIVQEDDDDCPDCGADNYDCTCDYDESAQETAPAVAPFKAFEEQGDIAVVTDSDSRSTGLYTAGDVVLGGP